MTAGLRGAALIALAAWCSVAVGQGIYPGIAVRVNGVEISYQRFNGFYLEHQRAHGVAIGARGDQLPLLKRLRREAMDLMVEQELVAQAAQKNGIEAAPQEVDATLAELREPFKTPQELERRLQNEGYTEQEYREHVARMIAAKKYLDQIRASVAAVSDEELERYYNDNKIRLTFPEQVRVRHILLTWKPIGTTDDRAAVREQMEEILAQARAGADFAELARTRSEDATARDGGDTGFFHRGQMVPAFEQVAFSLKPGEISDLVETPFGVHIIKLEERKEPRLLPLEEVREQLREHVSKEKQEEAVARETARLRAAAHIEILIPL